MLKYSLSTAWKQHRLNPKLLLTEIVNYHGQNALDWVKTDSFKSQMDLLIARCDKQMALKLSNSPLIATP